MTMSKVDSGHIFKNITGTYPKDFLLGSKDVTISTLKFSLFSFSPFPSSNSSPFPSSSSLSSLFPS